ncbi:MAG TPA: helix-turn-helix transcriptional regulator, partial [Gaiellaceae bacterium]|nr:helix-turn-helix transcriptional regulator [Gaiellaceae bacterium]
GPPFGRGGFPFAPFFFAGGPGGFRRGLRARRGDVRAAALLLLAEEPRNGYQLMQEIEARSNGVWRPSPGSVYPALSQLEDEGLVRAEEGDGRRTFTLTDAGRAYVEEHRDELGAPWDEMSGAVDDDVAGLATEVRQVLMAVGQIGHVGNPRQIATASKILTDARRALYGILAEDEPAEKDDGE